MLFSAEAAASKERGATLDRVRVLVVEDDVDTLNLLKFEPSIAIRQAGYPVMLLDLLDAS
jgi:hypothetical protein